MNRFSYPLLPNDVLGMPVDVRLDSPRCDLDVALGTSLFFTTC
jgi:hypothetical protein